MEKSLAQDGAEQEILRCLLFGRNTMDLLCDSLEIQCHQVRRSLDLLETAGLVRHAGESGTARLTVQLTEAGRQEAEQHGRPGDQSLTGWQLAADDVTYLRRLGDGAAQLRRAECEWGVGATRQHLWELGLIDVVGFVQPRAVLTDRGRQVIEMLEGVAA